MQLFVKVLRTLPCFLYLRNDFLGISKHFFIYLWISVKDRSVKDRSVKIGLCEEHLTVNCLAKTSAEENLFDARLTRGISFLINLHLFNSVCFVLDLFVISVPSNVFDVLLDLRLLQSRFASACAGRILSGRSIPWNQSHLETSCWLIWLVQWSEQESAKSQS